MENRMETGSLYRGYPNNLLPPIEYQNCGSLGVICRDYGRSPKSYLCVLSYVEEVEGEEHTVT